MASLIRSVELEAPVDSVWALVKDFFHPNLLAPGFVAEATRDGDERVVTFASGATVHEVLIGCDDPAHRLSYASVQGRSDHHNASMQVIASPVGSQLVWITDVLPDELADYIGDNMDRGLEAIHTAITG